MPTRSFVHIADLPEGSGGSRRAVEVEMSRLAKAGAVRSVRKGLYWKGPRTRSGMVPPSPRELGVAVGGVGSGPSGISAARFLGLTTQVPAVTDVAVPGRAPDPVDEVVFHSRPYERAVLGLRPAEVAVLEMLRVWPRAAEDDWSALADRVMKLRESGEIRPRVVTQAANREHVPAVRDLWNALLMAPRLAQ